EDVAFDGAQGRSAGFRALLRRLDVVPDRAALEDRIGKIDAAGEEGSLARADIEAAAAGHIARDSGSAGNRRPAGGAGNGDTGVGRLQVLALGVERRV